MDNQQNISSTFTNKSDSVLSEIMAKYKLEESSEEIIKKLNEGPAMNAFLLTKFTMNYSRGEMSEKEFIDSVQKELNISQQTAEQIVKEIINNIIPTLGKRSENKKNMEIPAKIKSTTNIVELTEKPAQNPINETDEKLKVKSTFLPKKPGRIKKSAILEKIKEPIIQAKMRTGPDSYREPIE